MKSFRPKDHRDDDPPAAGRNAERDFKGEKRSNETHASTTDPDARLYRKGDRQSSRLCFMGHLLIENRNALIVDAALTRASGTAEPEAALQGLLLSHPQELEPRAPGRRQGRGTAQGRQSALRRDLDRARSGPGPHPLPRALLRTRRYGE